MPGGINIELLVAGIGTAMVLAGVVMCTWGMWRKAPLDQPHRLRRRAVRMVGGGLLTAIGLYIALKKYLEDSGWAQWIESMLGWLIPLVGSTLIIFGAAVLFWALFADRSRGRKRCPRCWYDMGAVPGLVCPECGKDAKLPSGLLRTRRRRRWAFFGLLLLLLGNAQFAESWIRRGAWVHAIPTRALIYALPWYQTQQNRLLWEFESRVVEVKLVASNSGVGSQEALHKQLSEASVKLLARRVLDALELTKPHPARLQLFRLAPKLLGRLDPARAERLAIGALADPDPEVQRCAVILLRKLTASNPQATLEGVLTMVSSLTAGGSRGTEEGALLEAARFLKESTNKDPRVIKALIDMLQFGSGQRSFGGRYDYALRVETTQALAECGPGANAALPTLRPPIREDWTSGDPLSYFAVAMIEGTHGDRQRILLDMYLLPEWRFRDFAIKELASHTPTEDSIATMLYALKDEINWVRLSAATGLLGLHKEEAAAQGVVFQELESGSFDAAWRVVDIAGRYELDLDRVEKVVQNFRQNSNVPPGNIENLLRRIAQYRSGELPDE